MTGHCYLGGFLGKGAAQQAWVDDKVEGWAESVCTLSGLAWRRPQTAYAGLQKSLQQEWQFLQRVTPGQGTAFPKVEDALRDDFIPALFKGAMEALPAQGITCLPCKAAGMAIPDPTKMA